MHTGRKVRQSARASAVVATLVAASVTALGGCDPGYALTGSARNDSGAPLAGAIAETQCPQARPSVPTAMANAAGEFAGRGLGSFGDDCTIEVRAGGYASRRFAVPSICTRRSKLYGCLEVKVDAVLARAR